MLYCWYLLAAKRIKAMPRLGNLLVSATSIFDPAVSSIPTELHPLFTDARFALPCRYSILRCRNANPKPLRPMPVQRKRSVTAFSWELFHRQYLPTYLGIYLPKLTTRTFLLAGNSGQFGHYPKHEHAFSETIPRLLSPCQLRSRTSHIRRAQHLLPLPSVSQPTALFEISSRPDLVQPRSSSQVQALPRMPLSSKTRELQHCETPLSEVQRAQPVTMRHVSPGTIHIRRFQDTRGVQVPGMPGL